MDESTSDFEIRLDELRERYLARCRRRVEHASEWAQQVGADSSAVEKLHAMAHEMAGSGATYGYPAITLLAGQIEELLAPAHDEGFAVIEDARVDEVSDVLDRLRDAIAESHHSDDS
jgi:HPt (histidine-containing phosphotransfer) domain-containing protein